MVNIDAVEMTPANVRPIVANDFDRISTDLAVATRLTRDPRLAEWLGKTYALVVHQSKQPLDEPAVLVIDLDCPCGTISIGLPGSLLPALGLAIASDVTATPAIAPLVASRLLAPILEHFCRATKALGVAQWQEIGISAVRLIDPSNMPPILLPIVTWDAVLSKRTHTKIALLAIDIDCALFLQDVIASLPVRQPVLATQWRIETVMRFATRSWTIALLRSLELGDVVLCREGVAIDTVDGHLYCGAQAGVHWTGRIRINHQKVTIMSEMQEQDGRNASDAVSSAPLLSASLSDLEVPVHFEIDSAALSLAQLSSLRPGYVIELSMPVEEAEIRLVACGQIIGRGKLVVIGDCLGVQLESIPSGSA